MTKIGICSDGKGAIIILGWSLSNIFLRLCSSHSESQGHRVIWRVIGIIDPWKSRYRAHLDLTRGWKECLRTIGQYCIARIAVTGACLIITSAMIITVIWTSPKGFNLERIAAIIGRRESKNPIPNRRGVNPQNLLCLSLNSWLVNFNRWCTIVACIKVECTLSWCDNCFENIARWYCALIIVPGQRWRCGSSRESAIGEYIQVNWIDKVLATRTGPGGITIASWFGRVTIAISRAIQGAILGRRLNWKRWKLVRKDIFRG